MVLTAVFCPIYADETVNPTQHAPPHKRTPIPAAIRVNKGLPSLGRGEVNSASPSMSQLHLSAFEGDANIVRGRIELGEDPNSTDEVGVRAVLQSIYKLYPRADAVGAV